MTHAFGKSLAAGVIACLVVSPRTGRAGEGVRGWGDDAGARLEALAVLQTLNAELLSHDSATLTLERWCDAHRLATPASIVAERVHGIDKPPSAAQRQELHVTATDAVRYRRVRLRCGTLVLSEADNWYVPGRLTPAMNDQLDGTDAPFGKVARALQFQRHTLSTRLLWRPLPDGWDMQPDAVDNRPQDTHARRDTLVPQHVLEHSAVLTLPDGTPISEVVETYTANVLAFPVPRPH